MNTPPIATVYDYAGVFLVALATLMLEILVTRIFSVTLWYHLAFVAVSIAMFGMTLGAVLVYLCSRWFTPARVRLNLTVSSALFGVAAVWAVDAHLRLAVDPALITSPLTQLSVAYGVIAVPFVFSGIAISVALVQFPGQTSRLYAADLVGASSSDDVALIRLRETADLTPVELGDSDELQVGDSVVAVGNALNLGATPTVTTGIVSALNRAIDAESEHLENLIQTDAAINRGNSGGPLVNAEGKVIGVNTAIAADGQNIGFALAINEVKAIIESVRNGGGDRTTAFLGVRTLSVADVSAAVRDRLGIDLDEGAFVQAVEPGTAAADAGLEAGDVITKVDDTTVRTAASLTEAIQDRKPGDQVRITYVRDGDTRTANVTLGSKADISG